MRPDNCLWIKEDRMWTNLLENKRWRWRCHMEWNCPQCRPHNRCIVPPPPSCNPLHAWIDIWHTSRTSHPAAPSSSPLVSIDKQQRSSNWRLFHRRWKWKITNIFLRGGLLQTPVIYFSNVNSVQHYSILSALVFRCCKLLNLQTLKVDKTGKKVFSYYGGYFFGNMLNQNEIYLPSRVQSKHICQLTLWMCMWIEDINLNPQCKESCTQNRATLM